MKKLFITAVALVAFSTVSLANTTTDKQTINETIETALNVSESQVLLEDTEKAIVSDFCDVWAASALEEMDPNGNLGNVTSFHIYRSYVEACEAATSWIW